MKVQVQLLATLTGYLPATSRDHGATLDVPDGSTIRDVIQRLGIPEDIATITLVNGHDASSEQILNEGDTVSMFPPLAGGCAGLRGSFARMDVGSHLTDAKLRGTQ